MRTGFGLGRHVRVQSEAQDVYSCQVTSTNGLVVKAVVGAAVETASAATPCHAVRVARALHAAER